MTEFHNELENGDIGDPMRWLHRYFDSQIALGAEHSVSVEWNEDEIGVTRMVITIERTE